MSNRNKKKVEKLALPDTYIQDKGKMATDILERMQKSKVIYSDLLKSLQRKSSLMKELVETGTQVSSLFGKLGSLHPGDLGLVFKDIVSYLEGIDKAYLDLSESIMQDFIFPITKSMEPHHKELNDLTRDVKANVASLVKQMTVSEKELKKAGKSGQTELVQKMQEFNKKKDDVDKKKADILLNVLLKERERYIYLLEHFLKTLDSEIIVGKQIKAMDTDMQRWKDICLTKNALSEEQINALATASEQSFRQLHTENNSNSNENMVFLYTTTSIGLKNLDEEKSGQQTTTVESARRVSKSNYVARASLSPRPDSSAPTDIDTSSAAPIIIHPDNNTFLTPSYSPRSHTGGETNSPLNPSSPNSSLPTTPRTNSISPMPSPRTSSLFTINHSNPPQASPRPLPPSSPRPTSPRPPPDMPPPVNSPPVNTPPLPPSHQPPASSPPLFNPQISPRPPSVHPPSIPLQTSPPPQISPRPPSVHPPSLPLQSSPPPPPYNPPPPLSPSLEPIDYAPGPPGVPPPGVPPPLSPYSPFNENN